MEFRLIVSKIHESQLLRFFPSKNLIVQSVGEDGHSIYLKSNSSQMVSGMICSAEKEDFKVVKGQKQQANIESSDESSDQPQQLVPTKPPITLNHLSVNSNGRTKQQDSCSEPSNASASQLSRVSVTSEPALSDVFHQDHHDESSADLLDQPVFEQETPAGDSETVVPSSSKLVMELTKKKKHTVHCFLHHTELKCSSCKTLEECQSNYDKGFASAFGQFLDKDPNNLQPSLENSSGDNFLEYIKAHLQTQSCPSPCSRLWRYCADHKLFSLFKYAPEGLLIHSNSRQNAVGTIINTYLGYKDENKKLIGSGGFGKVYEFSDKRAVKEEFKQPLINGNELLFHRIMGLDHPHVIKVLEYITGPNNENKYFLSVMPFKNQKDLQKQFTKEKHLTCVLDYMIVFQDQKKFIFRNYTVLFRHVFEGLCYLKSQGVVHRDIKSSNILVHQECKCTTSPLQCTCVDDGGVTYLLGDMDLLSLEEDENLTYTLEEWQKMAGHDPAGTIGMKPPESFFRTKKGNRVTNHKSDVWSACVTMMNILIGKAVNDEAEEQITKFISAATESTKAAIKTLTESLNVLGSIITKFKSLFSQMKLEQSQRGLISSQISGLNANLAKLKQWLTSCERILHQSQSFQGGFCEIYKEENPLARILTTAHGAQVLHWKCLTKQKIYGTQLWIVMKQVLDAIVAGIKFVPDRRQDATEIVQRLEKIPPVDCSDDEQKTN